jgi:hypothetical protein
MRCQAGSICSARPSSRAEIAEFVDRRRDVVEHNVDAPTNAVVLTVVEKASSRLPTALSLGCR